MKRSERINLVIERIKKEAPQSSLGSAWSLLDLHLNDIEDKYSGEISDPSKYGQHDHKRMYLPTLGSGIYSKCGNNSWEINLLSCQLYLSECGGIRIDVVDTGEIILDKESKSGGSASPC